MSGHPTQMNRMRYTGWEVRAVLLLDFDAVYDHTKVLLKVRPDGISWARSGRLSRVGARLRPASLEERSGFIAANELEGVALGDGEESNATLRVSTGTDAWVFTMNAGDARKLNAAILHLMSGGRSPAP